MLNDARLVATERAALTPDGKRYELHRATVESVSITLSREGVHFDWIERTAVTLARERDALRDEAHV